MNARDRRRVAEPLSDELCREPDFDFGRPRDWIFLPLLLLLLLVAVPATLVAELRLRAGWWLRYGRRGKRVLVVYSESEKWRPWIEQGLLPLVGELAVVVDKSTDPSWKFPRSFARRAHEHWSVHRRAPLVVFLPGPLKGKHVLDLERALLSGGRPNPTVLASDLELLRHLLETTRAAPS